MYTRTESEIIMKLAKKNAIGKSYQLNYSDEVNNEDIRVEIAEVLGLEGDEYQTVTTAMLTTYINTYNSQVDENNK